MADRWPNSAAPRRPYGTTWTDPVSSASCSRLNERTDRARREAAWDAAGARVAELLRTHGTVAFATIGDPNVYSTFTYLAATVTALLGAEPVAEPVEVATVPGITAMQDLAARSGAVLTEGTETVDAGAGDGRVRGAEGGAGGAPARWWRTKFGRLAE